MPTQALEARQAAQTDAVRAVNSAYAAEAASLRENAGGHDLAEATSTARTELKRAEKTLGAGHGKASKAGLAALSDSMDALEKTLADGSAYDVTASVMSLRESEKAVTDSIAAWKKAEQKRLAAAKAARAAALAAQEYEAAHRAQATTSSSGSSAGWSSEAQTSSSSSSSSPVSSSSSAPAAPAPVHSAPQASTHSTPARSTGGSSAPHFAPGVPHERPDNSGCGPCPGATLVLTSEGYWGCPS